MKNQKSKNQPNTLTVDILLLIVIIIILSVVIFAENKNETQSQQNQDQPAQISSPMQTPVEDPVSHQLTKLKKELQLTEAQMAAVREILESDQKQAVKDREKFKIDAPGLIKAAWDRRGNTNSRIEVQLNEQQKEKFREITKMTPFDRELFDLTEGLLLDDDQAFTVEGILIEYYNKFKELMPGEVPDRIEKGNVPPGGRGSGPAGREMGMRNAVPFKRFMNDLRRQKDRAIKKILTDEQKKLFEQFKEYREKMKENRYGPLI